MSISEKIEEIRKKPEHIRLRYVWAGVLITMLFIVIIWFLSLQEMIKSFSPPTENTQYLEDQWKKTKENMPSIEEFMKGTEKELENEIKSPNEQKMDVYLPPSPNTP